jgi:hypothetical protein
VSLKGKNIQGKDYRAILDCLATVDQGKLIIQAMDIQGTFAVKLEYQLDKLSPIEAGTLPIGDIEHFEEFLARFETSNDVTVSIEGNKIVIERTLPHKIARIPMADISTITSKETPALTKLQFSQYGFPTAGKTSLNLSITIDAESIKNIFEDGNVIKQRILPWKVDNNQLRVSIGSEQFGEFETEVALEDLQSDPEKPGLKHTQAAFGNGLDNIFANLSGKVKIFLADEVENGIMVVTQETDKYKFLAMLAPHATKE